VIPAMTRKKQLKTPSGLLLMSAFPGAEIIGIADPLAISPY